MRELPALWELIRSHNLSSQDLDPRLTRRSALSPWNVHQQIIDQADRPDPDCTQDHCASRNGG
jgi:hypothetical protein